MKASFWTIMAFYAVLSCVIGPLVGQYFIPSKDGLEKGYLGGTLLSVVLWFMVGKKMVS
jgi:hypothetical protein